MIQEQNEFKIKLKELEKRHPNVQFHLLSTSVTYTEAQYESAMHAMIEGAVLAGWAKRCGAECAREWNETVGKVLGLKAPTG